MPDNQDDLFGSAENEVNEKLDWLRNVGLSYVPTHPDAPNVYWFMLGRIAQYGVFVIGEPSKVQFMSLSWTTDYTLKINRQRKNPNKIAQEILNTYPTGGKKGIARWLTNRCNSVENIGDVLPHIHF